MAEPIAPLRLDRVELALSTVDAAASRLAAATGLEPARPVGGEGVDLLDGDGAPLIGLRPTGPGLRERVTYAIEAEVLPAVVASLREAGVEVDDAGPDGVATLRDPDGTVLGLRGVDGPRPEPGPGPVRLLHAGLRVADLARSEAFYEPLLGFRVSDWIGDIASFLRCRDRYHHSLALLVADPPGGVEHLCVVLPDLDALMRSRVRAQAAGCTFESDVLRHAPSHSISFYYWLDDARTVRVEHCCDHEAVDPDRVPRRLAAVPETRNLWLS